MVLVCAAAFSGCKDVPTQDVPTPTVEEELIFEEERTGSEQTIRAEIDRLEERLDRLQAQVAAEPVSSADYRDQIRAIAEGMDEVERMLRATGEDETERARRLQEATARIERELEALETGAS